MILFCYLKFIKPSAKILRMSRQIVHGKIINRRIKFEELLSFPSHKKTNDRSLFETLVKLRTFDHLFAFCRHFFLDGPVYLIHSELVNLLQLCHGVTHDMNIIKIYTTVRGYIVRWWGTNRGMAKKSWSTATKATTETAS